MIGKAGITGRVKTLNYGSDVRPGDPAIGLWTVRIQRHVESSEAGALEFSCKPIEPSTIRGHGNLECRQFLVNPRYKRGDALVEQRLSAGDPRAPET